jgi:hypothetical protein
MRVDNLHGRDVWFFFAGAPAQAKHRQVVAGQIVFSDRPDPAAGAVKRFLRPPAGLLLAG